MKSNKPVKSTIKSKAAPKKVVAKVAPKKVVAKVAPKKVVAKVAPKKVVAKVAPKKVVAKVAPKKVVAKVAPKKTVNNQVKVITQPFVQSVMTFLNNNEKIIKLYTENVGKYRNNAEHLANLIVGLITNDKIASDKSKDSLNQIMAAAMGIGQKISGIAAKSSTTKKVVNKK